MNIKNLAVDLAPHLEAAEKVVVSIKDPRLREIAFGRILDHLLAPGKNSNFDGAVSPTVSKQLAKKPKSSGGVTAWLQELVADSFFSEPRSAKQILDELSNRSHHLRGADLTRQLQKLCHTKVLRRRKQSPVAGGAELFHWSNW